MTAEEYIQEVRSRLKGAFDFASDGKYLGKQYDMAAVFHERVEQTALFRENVTDWYENTQVCLLACVSCEEDIKAALEELKDITVQSAKPSRHHRCTTVIWVGVKEKCGAKSVECRGNSKKCREDRTFGTQHSSLNTCIKHYRFSRSFKFGFYGWCEAAVLLADLASGQVISNWAGRGIRKYFLIPNP